MSHWEFNHPINIDEWHGFVYTIHELDTGRLYIGKKAFKHKVSRPPLKGRKNKRITYKESDWQTYTGSSKELNENIQRKGIGNYRFLIDSLHKTKASLSYREVERIILENAIRNPQYFNKHADAVKYIPPAETLDELLHRKR